MSIPRCAWCFRINDVQPMSDIVIQDEGLHDSHYFAVYCHEYPKLRCASCRHRISAMERLIGMWQRQGRDITWLD